MNYNWKDDANWVEAAYPPSAGGHDIDLSASNVLITVGANLSQGQSIEHLFLPSETMTFSAVYGRYGRWLEVFSPSVKDIPTVTVDDPSNFFGLWRLNCVWPFVLNATADKTPVLQRYSVKGSTTVTVPTAGTTAIISNVVETGVFSKAGAGTLKVVNPGGNATGVRLKAGTLVFEGTPRMSAQEIEAVMAKAVFHVDASRADSIATNAQGRVQTWSDVRGTGYPVGQQLIQNGYTLPLPKVARGYQNGLDVLDFGPYTNAYKDAVASGENCTLYFNDTSWFNKGNYLAEAFVVEGLHDEGTMPACLFAADIDKGMRRGSSATLCLTDTSASSVSATTENLNARDGDWGINRRHVLPTDVWTNAQMRVFSLRTRDEKGYMRIRAWGTDYGSNVGGLRVGEALYFTNHLSQAERNNLIRHLTEKWGCAQDGVEDSYDVGYLFDASSATTFDAPKDVSIREIAWPGATFEKTGAGHLEVGCVRHPATGSTVNLTVTEGELSFGPLVRPADNPQIAAGSFRHYDASSARFTYAEGSASDITAWQDESGDAAKAATRIAQTKNKVDLGYPKVVTAGLNGLTTLDLGTYVTQPTAENGAATAAGLQFDTVTDFNNDKQKRLRTIFLVSRRNDYSQAAWYFGAAQDSTYGISFHPTGYSLWRDCYAHASLLGAEATLDGLPFDWSARDERLGEYHVLRFSLLDNLSADTFGVDRAGTSVGGISLAEVILYDRVLTRQETIDTEAYLLRKWFNKSHPNAATPTVAAYALGASATPAIDTTGDMNVNTLSVSGNTFTKKGSGSLDVGALASGSDVRNLLVEEGTLELNLNVDTPLFHFDAEDAASFATFATANGDGSYRTNVTTWADTRANGLTATSLIRNNAVTNPALVTVETRPGVWRSAVDFGKYVSDKKYADGTTAAMVFSERFTNVREVFTVNADKASAMPFLFCDSSTVDYHRGGSRQLFNTNYTGMASENDLLIYFNGVSTNWTAIPAENAYYVVNVARGKNTSVSQMSQDRASDSYRSGGIVICEQIGFSERLSDARRAYMNRYLAYKWFNEGPRPVFTNDLDTLFVAAGATLNVSSANCLAVDAFSGAGTLDGGLTLNGGATWRATASADSVRALHVSGALGSTGSLTIEILPEAGVTLEKGIPYTLAVAGSLDLDLGKVRLVLPAGVHGVPRISYEGSALVVRIFPKGMVLDLR